MAHAASGLVRRQEHLLQQGCTSATSETSEWPCPSEDRALVRVLSFLVSSTFGGGRGLQAVHRNALRGGP